jgi:hypothetical protein
MSYEQLYRYFKQQPSYIPNKFDIIGGFPSDTKYDEFTNIVAELGFDIVEPEEIVTVIGGETKSRNKTASTVDDRLIQLFAHLDTAKVIRPHSKKKKKTKPKTKPKNAKSKPHTRKRTRKGGEDDDDSASGNSAEGSSDGDSDESSDSNTHFDVNTQFDVNSLFESEDQVDVYSLLY